MSPVGDPTLKVLISIKKLAQTIKQILERIPT